MAEDEEIILSVLGGDVEAFRALVERYEKPLFRLARNLLGDAHASEDAVQDAFLSAFRGLADFDPGRARFSTWLFVIARNRCLNVLKKKAAVPLEAPPEVSVLRQPEEDMDGKSFREELDRALDRLPPDQKTAFVLKEFAGLSSEEIARIEGAGAGTIRSRVSRAREALRGALKSFAGDEP